MIFDWMSQTEAQWQNRNFVFTVVVVWQLYLPIEEREQMLCFQALWHGVRPVTLQAQGVAFGTQQVFIFAPVRSVTGGAAF